MNRFWHFAFSGVPPFIKKEPLSKLGGILWRNEASTVFQRFREVFVILGSIHNDGRHVNKIECSIGHDV